MPHSATRPKRVLITGGAGFIGSHLAEYLLDLGHQVHSLDDLSTGSMENLDITAGRPNFSYTIADMRQEPLLAELVDRADVVYHLAAAVGVRLIVEDPVHTIETNVGCTEIILRMVRKKKKKIIIASTSEVYGKNEEIPFREDHDLVLGPTVKARWAYACSKAIDEFLALAYCRQEKLPVIIARLFNTVGPRQTGRYGMVLPTFVRQALTGQPLTVFGTGGQSRCFSYVSEVVEALNALSLCPAAVGQVINVGSSQEITINDLARMVLEVTGSACGIKHVPYDEAYEEGFEDMARRVPSTDKLRSLTGLAPRMPVKEIISRVADYYRLNPEECG